MSIVPGRPRQTSSAEDGGQPKGCEKKTMIDLRLAYNDPSLSRIRKNPRQWKLFLYLLAHADEKGYVEMSLRQIADEVKMPFSTIQSMMTSVSFRSVLGHISVSQQTLISIYHIERYSVS